MSQGIIAGRLAGKVAIITGSTYGIGFSTAKRFAQEGAKVIVSSRNRENVDKATQLLLQEGLNVKGVVCHVGNKDDRLKLLQAASAWGGLDILVMNAGVNPSKEPILECQESAWDKIQNVNLKSAFLMTKEALPLLRQSSSARIIYTSTVGIYTLIDKIGAYTVSKVGLVGLTKMVAKQLGSENITVNCISPGLIETSFAGILINDKEIHDSLLSAIALRRLGKPVEVANATLFLASDEASYITGENICVGGGLPTRL